MLHRLTADVDMGYNTPSTGLGADAQFGQTANNKVMTLQGVTGLSDDQLRSLNSGPGRVLVGGDEVSLVDHGYAASFGSAGVSNGIAVSVSGLTMSGASATNYTLTQPVGWRRTSRARR